MREKIARFLLEARYAGYSKARRLTWDEMLTSKYMYAEYMAMADAALDAMWEPTPSMEMAAIEPYKNDKPLHPTHGIESAAQLPAWHLIHTAWQAMLSAAKAGK